MDAFLLRETLEGSLCLQILGIFFPESGILPTNTCTRLQMPGLVGGRDIYWNPGSVPAVQNHPNHHTVPKSGVFTSQHHLSSVTACCLR